MDRFHRVVLCFMLCMAIARFSAWGQTVADELKNDTAYSLKSIPNGIHEDPLLVSIDVYLLGVSELDEQKMQYSVSVYLRQYWNDKRLVSEQSNGSADDYFSMPLDVIEQIFVPDVLFENMKTGDQRDVPVPSKMLRLYPNGDIYYSQGMHLTLTCPMNLRAYPMDTQECKLRLSSFSFTDRDIILKWKSTMPLQLEDYYTLPEFELSGSDYYNCTTYLASGNYSCLEAKLVFRRELNHYLLQVYIPTTMVVILSWLSFWVDADVAAARVSLGLLTALAITQYVSSFTDPDVSYVMAIDVWMVTTLIFVFSSMIEFSIACVLLRREQKEAEQQSHQSDTNSIGFSSQMQTGKREECRAKGHSVDQGSSDQAFSAPVAYSNSCKTRIAIKSKHVDVFSRFAFPAAFVLFNIIYWAYYKNKY